LLECEPLVNAIVSSRVLSLREGAWVWVAMDERKIAIEEEKEKPHADGQKGKFLRNDPGKSPGARAVCSGASETVE
jgi:hypothetical protein